MDVTVIQSGNERNMFKMWCRETQERILLRKMSCRVHERMEEDASAHSRTKDERQCSFIRLCISEAGENTKREMPNLWGKSANASSRLFSTITSNLVMQETPHGRT